tara:strand:+ start:729 stop:830 length:102 start_codon:yes stop_codon:yes gene_type:complete
MWPFRSKLEIVRMLKKSGYGKKRGFSKKGHDET